MSNEESWGFTTPPFKVEEALVQLKRALRDLGLKERAEGFEQAGRRVLEFELGEGQIAVRLAQRLQVNTPNWDKLTLKTAADHRKLIDELKKRLARWRDED